MEVHRSAEILFCFPPLSAIDLLCWDHAGYICQFFTLKWPPYPQFLNSIRTDQRVYLKSWKYLKNKYFIKKKSKWLLLLEFIAQSSHQHQHHHHHLHHCYSKTTLSSPKKIKKIFKNIKNKTIFKIKNRWVEFKRQWLWGMIEAKKARNKIK